MADFGLERRYVLPELRRRTFRDHSVHPETMVGPDGELNLHLAFVPGLTPTQSRAILRDMEREQRRQVAEAEMQHTMLQQEKREG